MSRKRGWFSGDCGLNAKIELRVNWPGCATLRVMSRSLSCSNLTCADTRILPYLTNKRNIPGERIIIILLPIRDSLHTTIFFHTNRLAIYATVWSRPSIRRGSCSERIWFFNKTRRLQEEHTDHALRIEDLERTSGEWFRSPSKSIGDRSAVRRSYWLESESWRSIRRRSRVALFYQREFSGCRPAWFAQTAKRGLHYPRLLIGRRSPFKKLGRNALCKAFVSP